MFLMAEMKFCNNRKRKHQICILREKFLDLLASHFECEELGHITLQGNRRTVIPSGRNSI
jgi:hypothetical protein